MPKLLLIAAAAAAAGAILITLRGLARRTLLGRVRAGWGREPARDRDLAAIASYHRALAGTGDNVPALDDRTWADLNMDDVFAVVDRTESTIGQQALYHRLRSSPVGDHLDAFEALTTRMTTDAGMREAAQLVLTRLNDKAGYDLWSLAQPGMIHREPWFVLFPMFAAAMFAALVLAAFWPVAVLLVGAGAAVSVSVRLLVAGRDRLVIGPFRQLGPLIAAAETLSRLRVDGAEPITASLGGDVAKLARLRRIASWVSRDASPGFDISGLLFEYLNLLFLLDANALYFGARELAARSPELLRVIAAVGEIDASIGVASFRAGTEGWTRPRLEAPGARAVLADVRHPLVPHAVPNSIALGPPHGVIVTGSNMSGKSTFLRTVGVTTVLAQTIHTCLAASYAAPVFVVRSCIGRADDLIAGKSYYIVEVESVLTLVRASVTPAAQLFLFDELFRGTNAVERIAAGEAVLASLVAPIEGRASPHVVLAATHDRELVDLLAATYAAYHFTDTVGDEGLIFNFRLEPGPATTRNAITLLRLHGAPADLVARALARAAELDRHRATVAST